MNSLLSNNHVSRVGKLHNCVIDWLLVHLVDFWQCEHFNVNLKRKTNCEKLS